MFPREVVKKLSAIINALKRDQEKLLVLTGPPRSGKSTLALRIARFIDLLFTIQRVTFSADNFKVACVESPRGSVVILDEAIKGGNARRAMSSENVGMMDWLAIWGHRNLCGIICYPNWHRLDPAIKDFVYARLHVSPRGVATWYDVYHPEHSDKPVLVARFKFRFDAIPEGAFRTAYEAAKEAFTKSQTKPKKGDARRKVTDKQRRIMVWLVNKKGKTHAEVAKQFGVSRPYVTQLVGNPP